MRTDALGPRLAAALLLAWGGLGPARGAGPSRSGAARGAARGPGRRPDRALAERAARPLERRDRPAGIDREHRPGDREAGPEHRHEIDAGHPASRDAWRGPERAAEVIGWPHSNTKGARSRCH